MAEIFNFSTIEENKVIEVRATKKFQKRRNDRKGQFSIVWRIFEIIAKKLKFKSQGPKSTHFWTFSDKFTKNNVFDPVT